LIFKFAGEKFKVPYFVDPMTYAFGTYVEHGETCPRTDLDWIKSDQRNRKTKETERLYKRSYRRLAEALGDPFLRAMKADVGIAPGQLDEGAITQMANSVVNYQTSRVRQEFESDPDFAAEAGRIPLPALVFAPYFYIDPSEPIRGLELLGACATAAKKTGVQVPVHAVLCTDVSMLADVNFLASAVDVLRGSGVDGVWLWFSQLTETDADEPTLCAFRNFVSALAGYLDVYNMHGGYFSLVLSRIGLKGVSHGIGYGEQKDVIPVIGQSTPTVRYYLPDGRCRLGVPEIERALSGIGVATAEHFFEKVCDCAICRGVLQNDLARFSAFGDMHYSTPKSARMAQTPAAAQRCRFHFLLNRARERAEMEGLSLDEVVARLSGAHQKWRGEATVVRSLKHLAVWRSVLSSQPTGQP
jgi:hypothetical protein